VNFSVEVESGRLDSALTKLAGQMGNVRPALRPAAERIVRAAREQIDTAGKRSGKPWAARAESTLKSITSTNRKGFTSIGLPGRASDRMFASVGTMGGPDSIYVETDDSVTVGTRVRSKKGFPYAAAFHHGTSRQPARPIYAPTERDVRQIVAVMKKSFRERIEPLGLDYQEGATDIVF
jgi:hypothetical protein